MDERAFSFNYTQKKIFFREMERVLVLSLSITMAASVAVVFFMVIGGLIAAATNLWIMAGDPTSLIKERAQ